MATTTLRRDQPLFEAVVPVRYCVGHARGFASKSSGAGGGGGGGDGNILGGDVVVDITVRVIGGTRFLGGGQSQRLLHLEWTKADDLGFLYVTLHT